MGTGAGGSPARDLLGPDHGAPFRVILPQWYAVASVKWLKRIDVLTEACTGEFQAGHYMDEWPDRPAEPVDVMRVRARITDRAPGATIDAGTYTVRGKAWSGSGRPTTVEVSLTGAGDWEPAQLEAAPDPSQWQDCSYTWPSPSVGRHTLRARATDAAGSVQPERLRRPHDGRRGEAKSAGAGSWDRRVMWSVGGWIRCLACKASC